MRTNVEDVYAAGDCAMVTNRETGEAAWSPMGSTANIAGRVLAADICGKNKEYAGVLGPGVAKLTGGINAGRTGLTEMAAKAAGYDVAASYTHLDVYKRQAQKRKRNLRKATITDATNVKSMKKILPYL